MKESNRERPKERHILEAFIIFRAEVLPPEATLEQLRICQQCFFAGASVVYMELAQDPDRARRTNDIAIELVDFANSERERAKQ